jgi:hypothetical protein
MPNQWPYDFKLGTRSKSHTPAYAGTDSVEVSKMKVLDLFSGIKLNQVLSGCNSFCQEGRGKLGIESISSLVCSSEQTSKRHYVCVLVYALYLKPYLRHMTGNVLSHQGIFYKSVSDSRLYQSFQLFVYNILSPYLGSLRKTLNGSLSRFERNRQCCNANDYNHRDCQRLASSRIGDNNGFSDLRALIVATDILFCNYRNRIFAMRLTDETFPNRNHNTWGFST